MGAAMLAQVRCDGPSLGLECHTEPSTGTNLIRLRASLRRRGWAWPHHGDVRVDLCPACVPHATLAPHRCGRPPKAKGTL